MRIHRVRNRIALLSAAILAMSLMTPPAQASTAVETAASTAPSSDELLETGAKQQRWLSLPESRIVLNPFDFRSTTSALEQSTAPQLPLDAGYYVEDSAIPVNDLLSIYQQPAGDPPGGGTTIDFRDDFSQLDPAWSAEAGLVSTARNGALELSIPSGGPPWAALTRWVTVDLDQHPVIQIRVNQAGRGSSWALKVNSGTEPVDTFIQGTTTSTGTLTYNVADTTGWSGTKTFKIRIFVIGQGEPVLIDDLRLQSDVDPWLTTATSQTHSWLPHTLPFTAAYADGMRITGEDYFHDKDSLVRSLSLSNLSNTVVFSGKYSGAITFDAVNRRVTVRSGAYEYAIDLPGVRPQIAYYESESDLLVGGPTLDSPASSGVWAVQLDPPAGQTSLTARIGIGFATTAEASGIAVQRAASASTSTGPAASKSFWDNALAEIPRPLNFAITAVDDKGLSAEQVRASYYRAWVFLLSDVLPAQPEIGFGYRQMSEGKASMWTEGADGARASTSWTSFMGMQYLAYVDPDLAWETFDGMMSLVDAQGQIGGESLPTRRAQTAWILHQVTGDTSRLADSYDDLKRNLLWSRDNPRWIYGDHDQPTERSSDFVVSLLVDFQYAGQIADALGNTADIGFWQQQYDAMLVNYLDWFWESPTSEPGQFYHVDSGWRHRGNSLWVTQGLHVSGLPADNLNGLKARFINEFHPESNFGGFAYPNIKFAEVEYTTYGLLDNGMITEAQLFSEITLRDTIRTGEFAEVYDIGLVGVGVRPSLFGALNIINAVLLINGVRIDQGAPSFIAFPRTHGGVEGLVVRGETLGAKVSARQQAVHLSGSLVQGRRTCRFFDAPVGTTVQIPKDCVKGM